MQPDQPAAKRQRLSTPARQGSTAQGPAGAASSGASEAKLHQTPASHHPVAAKSSQSQGNAASANGTPPAMQHDVPPIDDQTLLSSVQDQAGKGTDGAKSAQNVSNAATDIHPEAHSRGPSARVKFEEGSGAPAAAAGATPTGEAMDTGALKQEDGPAAVPEAEEEVDTGKVDRAVKAVAAVTGCDICGDVMRDPVTAPECMHSFCAACIDEYIFDLQARSCPVCLLEGVETHLGHMPYHHQRLQFDFALADVIRKLFPRPEVEQQIEERRKDERRFMEQAQRKGQQSEASPLGGTPASSLPGFAPSSAALISLLLEPFRGPHTDGSIWPFATASAQPGSTSAEDSTAHADRPALVEGADQVDGNTAQRCYLQVRTGAEEGIQPDGSMQVAANSEPAHQNSGISTALNMSLHLNRPYLRVGKDLVVGKLQQYILDQLREQFREHPNLSHPELSRNGVCNGTLSAQTVKIFCQDKCLAATSMLGDLHSRHGTHGRDVLLLRYQVAQA